jgi:hypothetical protein
MRSVQVSAAALAVAFTLVAWKLWRGIHLTVPSPSRVIGDNATTLSVSTPVSGYPLRRLLAAIEKDPFNPERQRPARRFRLPPDRTAIATRRPALPTAVAIRLVGTAVTPDGGGFAMCQLQGGTPRIVRLGEQVGGWTLKKVTPGSAEFATPTGSIVVRVAKDAS